MSFHLFLSSAALFTLSQVPKSDHSHISFIHILIGQPTFFFSSTLTSSICKCDKPVEPLNTCPAYSIFLFIMSLVKCNSVCNSICTRSMILGVETWSLQLIPNIFCNTTFQMHLLSCASVYSKSNSLTLIPIIQYREYIIVQNLHLCTKPDISS